MKKILTILVFALVLVSLLAACAGPKSEPAAESSKEEGGGSSKKLQIVASIFPIYDWTRNILGENPAGAEVTMLVSGGTDLHSYQPGAKDIVKISTCDLFIHVGGESDAWVSDALDEAVNQDMVVINLLDVLGDSVKEEEEKEGMEKEAEEEEGTAYDEHVWLSLKNAQLCTEAIAQALESLDPEHAGIYQSNSEAYQKELAALDQEYQEAVAEAPQKTLLFGDRFPFRYLVDDYGLDYYAAFSGCSAETEASFGTVLFLAEKTDELSLPAVMTLEGGDQRLANTIVQSTKAKDQKILTMDSLQSVTEKEAADGVSYLSVMRKNLEVLKEALQ